jgi:penicillin amidase
VTRRARVAAGIALAAVGATLALGGAGVAFLRRSLPRLSGEVSVAGVQARVAIVRDGNAVPHVEAGSDADAYFGLGFVHAQDRLWQMELSRRIGSGTLSEIFGPDGLSSDRFFRTLGLRRSAAEDEQRLDDPTRAVLEAYARGVNAYLDGSDCVLPPEFVLFGVEPRSWAPVDSLVWLKVMAWELAGNWRRELLRLQLSRRLSVQQIAEYLAPYPGDAAVALGDFPKLYAGLGSAADDLLRATPRDADSATGSNNWVIAGSRSQSGKPLLANDPHLELTAPSVWYLAHLHAPGLDVIGASLPGVPGIILGRNPRVAWAFTNTESDTKDLFVERLDPENGSRYLTPGGYRAFDSVREIVRVKGAADEVLNIRMTRHGPIVSDVDDDARAAMPAGMVLALSWVGTQSDDRTAQFPIRAAKSQNAAELRVALRSFHAPQQNVVYADADGVIGFVAAGRVPRRRPNNELHGLVPAPGWAEAYDWDGVLAFEELPQLENPATGRIVTANQKITPSGYEPWLTSEWSPPYRAQRIETLLDESPHHSVATFSKIQLDVRSGAAARVLPLLLEHASGVAAHEVQRLLETWDFSMSLDRTEPLIFAEWTRQLSRMLAADELGELFGDTWQEDPEFLANVLSDKDGQSRWCDDTTSPDRESCDEMVTRAAEAALAELERRYGSDRQGWTWGSAHRARSAHPVLSGTPVISRWVDLVSASGGDNHSVNLGGYSYDNEDEPFENRSGPGFRAIYDLDDLDRSVFVINSGESGHFLSPNYRNLGERWSRGEYVPMTMTALEYGRNALGTLQLRPR